jgi:quercetin dioxygenase-like cupin family protein
MLTGIGQNAHKSLHQEDTMAAPNILRSVDLHEEIARFSADVPSGRRSEILVKTPTLRVVLVTMKAGTESHEHAVEGPITIQALQGAFSVSAGGEQLEVKEGGFVALEGGVSHAVRAIEDGAFLLTISWQGIERDSE